VPAKTRSRKKQSTPAPTGRLLFLMDVARLLGTPSSSKATARIPSRERLDVMHGLVRLNMRHVFREQAGLHDYFYFKAFFHVSEKTVLC